MKLQKLANELKKTPAEVLAAAEAVGIAGAKPDTDVSDEQRSAIESFLTSGVRPCADMPADGSVDLVRRLVAEIACERVASAKLRPQIEQLLDSAIAEYRANGTVPANPLLREYVPVIAQAEGAPMTISVESIELQPLNLLSWANDPEGSADSLLLPAIKPLPLGAAE